MPDAAGGEVAKPARGVDKILRISDALVPINLFTQNPGNFVSPGTVIHNSKSD